MARRDISDLRTVTQVVGSDSGAAWRGVAQIGQEIIRQGEEAKINQSLSSLQVELSGLQAKTQTEYESDPAAGVAAFQAERQRVIDRYGDGISPLFRKPWLDSVRQVTTSSDMSQQSWMLKQARTNTANAINDGIRSDFSLATDRGRSFGGSDDEIVTALTDFTASRGRLETFGNRSLGPETTAKVLKDYDDDMMKSFLSGVTDTNPLKALRLMEDEGVKSSFRDVGQWQEMKNAIEARAVRMGEISTQKSILGAIRGENSILAQLVQGEAQPSYAGLQAAMDRANVTPGARGYFMRLAGFTKADDPALIAAKRGREDERERKQAEKEAKEAAKLTLDQKAELKEGIYDTIISMGDAGKPVTAETLQGLQQQIYDAASKGALTSKEAFDWTTQMIDTQANLLETSLEDYSSGIGMWVDEEIGLGALKKQFDETIVMQPAEGKKDVGAQAKRKNARNRVRLYDHYAGALGRLAAENRVSIGDIPSMDRTARRGIYRKAQAEAIQAFNAENYPSLDGQENTPNFIIPKVSAQNELPGMFKGAGGKSDISQADILDTARQHNMTPDQVVAELRRAGRIQ